MSENRTRPTGAHPRQDRPTPPSTRPPSTRPPTLRSQSAPGSGGQPGHEAFVQIANLQMARDRQQRIRSALQSQVDRCTQEIEQIDAKIRALYDRVGLEPRDEDAAPTPNADQPDDDGFEYEY